MPTRVFMGKGSLNSLCKSTLLKEKALLVTSGGKSVKESGALFKVLEQLEAAGTKVEVYNGITPNPSRSEVAEGTERFRETGCRLVVALGGGSVMDASKAIAIAAGNGGEFWDYVHGGRGKALPVDKPKAPLIAIPTTAGTGSEVNQWMVISDNETNDKIGFGYSGSFPNQAYVDSSLMVSVPPFYTAIQGIDALLHSVEGYITKKPNAITDALALRSIDTIGKHLVEAVKDGSNEAAREKMAEASTISGIVLANASMTAEHGMCDGLGGFFHKLPHGAALTAVSIEYFKFILEKHHSDERLADMARVLGQTATAKPIDFIGCLEKMYRKCGVEEIKMSDYGVKPELFRSLITSAKRNAPSEFGAEKILLSDDECETILMRAYR